MKLSYDEMIEQKPVEQRTADEIIDGIKDKINRLQ